MRLTPLDQDIDAGRKYLNERSLQVGHVLPVSEEHFREYFPIAKSFLGFSVRSVDALFSYSTGREKSRPRAEFFLVTDSLNGLRESVGKVEDTAVAQEKLVVQTRVFGYDRKRLLALKALGYKIGASIPDVVSLDGKRFDLHYVYKPLNNRYRFEVRRNYAQPGLYPTTEVEKAKNARLKVRAYRKEDRALLDKAATHLNVIRGIGRGVFEGSTPWGSRGSSGYDESVDNGRLFSLVCEDESIGEPVGVLDLSKEGPDVMQHVMTLGMYVRPDYHGIGVGTKLMDSMKTLAKRLHLTRVMLAVFEGNAPAEKLYRKVGFIECGKLPGWLQEGYIDETFMMLKLD